MEPQTEPDAGIVLRGRLTGNITVDGKTIAVTGNGYHDHNWGNVPPSDLLERWWWGRATVGDRTIVTYDIHAKSSASGSEIPLLYVGTPDRVEMNAFDQVKVSEGTPATHPDPRHPRSINSSVTFATNGTSVTFGTAGPMLLSLNLLDDQSWITKGVAGLLRMKPWYTRFRSPVSISRPRSLDDIAAEREVVLVDYSGVGLSTGTTSTFACAIRAVACSGFAGPVLVFPMNIVIRRGGTSRVIDESQVAMPRFIGSHCENQGPLKELTWHPRSKHTV